MEKEEEKWQATTNRFVAFFDIMGFKDMVITKGHEEVLKIIEDIKNATTAIMDGKMTNIKMQTNLKSFQFSDSFFIFSISDTPNDLLILLHQSKILLNYCFSQKIPLKGAISFGKVTADFNKSIFVGQPIIDAYLLHEELHMFGVILDHETEKKLKEFSVDEDFQENILYDVIQYKVPTKNGKIRHYCINWPDIVLHYGNGATYILKDKRNLEGFYSTVSGKPRIYVDNTLDFFDFLLDKAKKDYPNIQEFLQKKQQ